MPAPSLGPDYGRRAFSLPEMLVASALLMILTSLVTQFFIPALNCQRRGLVQSELMREGYRAMDDLIRDLRLCPAALLTYDPPEQRLVGRAQSGWTPDGTSVYSAGCWVYQWQSPERRLRRSLAAIGGGLQDTLVSPGRIGLCELNLALQGASWKVLCMSLVHFEFRHQGVDPTAPSGSYEVSMSLQQGQQHLEIHQSLTPRLKL